MTGVSQPVDENNLFRQAFSAEVVRYLAQQLDEGSEGFPKEAFLHWALRGLENLSFLDRAKHILRALELSLPKDFSSALPFLLKALGPEPSKDHLDGFEGFYIMPLTMYVSKKRVGRAGFIP
jgi:hypothetical protein